MKHRSFPLGALLLALTLPLYGCPGDRPAADEPWDEEPLAAEDLIMDPETIRLDEVNQSGITGEATATHTRDEVAVVLALTGLTPGQSYDAHVHRGRCAEGGPVAVPLEAVMAEQDGAGTSTTVVQAAELPPEVPVFIQVHGTGGAPVACGDVPGHGNGARTDGMRTDTAPQSP
jgi:hypothetical protein